MSVPADFEKFVRLSAALNREFDSALRQLREEQARRVDSLELQSTSRRRKSSADPSASADPAVGEASGFNGG